MERSVHLSAAIGAVAVLVHCRDQAAKDFYLGIGDFLVSPLDPLQLLAPIAELRRLITGHQPVRPHQASPAAQGKTKGGRTGTRSLSGSQSKK